MQTSTPTIRKGAGGTIGFRLAPREMDQLAAAAAEEGISIHQLAQRWVSGRLKSGGSDEAARDAAQRAESEVRRLREDLRVVLEGVLLAANVAEVDDVRRLVQEKLG